MDTIALTRDDIFRVLRSILFAELKRIRKNADLQFDESALLPDAPLAGLPGGIESHEPVTLASAALSFFALDGFSSSEELAALHAPAEWAAYLYDRWQPAAANIVFSTSGSTGEPKKVRLPYRFLVQDAGILGDLFPDAGRVVSMVPPHHIYGFIFTVLIPRRAGLPCADLRRKTPRQIFRELQPGDLLVSTPLFWKLFAEIGAPFPQSVSGVTSTAPCPKEIIQKLQGMGIKSLYEIYGSSESSCMGFRSDPEAPHSLSPAWTRIDGDRFVRTLADGSYSAPFTFQDRLEWLDDRHFYVRKRIDNAVQVAGINVFPSRVEELLLSHPAVAECAVRLMRPDEGDRLKAFVAPKDAIQDTAGLEEQLREHLAAGLTHLEMPRLITFGPTLPRNAIGKLADWSDERLTPKRPAAMTRREAIARLKEQLPGIEPDQEFTVGTMQPDDAPGVAHLFYAAYGEGYPLEFYYMPERLIEENRRGSLHTVVARTGKGDIIGCGALYRGSAPFAGLKEIGQYLVLPDYRATRAAFEIQNYLVEEVAPKTGIELFFGEAVCHQVISQKLGALIQAKETALEIGLMPADAYRTLDGAADRVSALLQFRTLHDRRQPLYLPEVYREQLEYLLSGCTGERDLFPADAPLPPDLSTRMTTEFFDYARVGRCQLNRQGADIAACMTRFEEDALARKCVVLQVFINLGEPWNGAGVELLRRNGYFLGGLVPRWFDSDGLLMQNVLEMPPLDSIKLYSERAHRILRFIRREIAQNPACLPFKEEALHPDRTAGGAVCPAAALGSVTLSGAGLTIEQVAAVTRHGAEVRLSDDRAVRTRLEASVSFIQWGVKTGEPIYGVNTGFGGMANVTIPEQELPALQNNLLRFLHAGAGDYLPAMDVRGAMLLRVNSHMKGVSGVRPELIERMALFINRGATPLVRELGSIGASGDLIPLATIAGAVTGASAHFQVEYEGERLDALTVLSRLGLEPLELGPKEGLAMVNGTSVMSAIAANCLYEVRNLIPLALGFHAFAIQALLGTNQSFHPFIQQVKPHPGQIWCAARMLELLKGSAMCRNELDGHHDSQGDQPVQDRYSLRCLPQYLGPVIDGFRQAVASVETEMNSASDNPLIDGENCVSYHSGNFMGEYVGVWMDHLRYYLGLLAKHMDTQIALLVAPEFNGSLPASLVGNRERAVNMGLKGLQIAANSIIPLLLHNGRPIADLYPTHAEQFNQNINSQGFNAAVLARKSANLLRSYTAMALLFGVQAVSLRMQRMQGGYDPRSALSPATAAIYEAVFGVLGREPSCDRPLIRNDDEQSFEQFVALLENDIAAEGTLVASVRPLIEALKGV
jgi:phenylalanine ammonia-lyase